MKYALEITQDTNGTYLVICPDLPEVLSVGDSIEDALVQAVDAIETAFIIYMDDKRMIPLPTTLGQYNVSIRVLVQAKVALYNLMLANKVRKADMARRLGWNPVQVDRLLDIHHSTKLESLESAFGALGKHLDVAVA
jgi:antitoxin HicB